jgi:hypothetical protein
LHQPVPRPTKAALALNKAEEDSRGEQTMLARAMGMVSRHPDVSTATKVGDPALNDPTPVSASDLVQRANRVAGGAKGGEHSVSVQTTGKGEPGPNEPAPTSDAPVADKASSDAANAEPAADPNELNPNATQADPKAATDPKAGALDPNELQPTNSSSDPQPAPAPAQVNDLAQATTSSGGDAQAGTNGNQGATASSNQDLADDNAIASSKRKKKKGLSKIIPVPKLP